MTDQRVCPCGGAPYATCCEPFHQGPTQAPTAEALMRSRYSAFALGLDDYLWRTWHPRTRPERVDLDDTQWIGLEIVAAVAGSERDPSGIVEFVAHYRDGRRRGSMRERSRFERRGGRWLYVDGVTGADGPAARADWQAMGARVARLAVRVAPPAPIAPRPAEAAPTSAHHPDGELRRAQGLHQP